MNHRENAIEQARQATRWVGEEPVTVSAPVEAQVSTTFAVLALADEVRALREALCGEDNDPVSGGVIGDVAGAIGEAAGALGDVTGVAGEVASAVGDVASVMEHYVGGVE